MRILLVDDVAEAELTTREILRGVNLCVVRVADSEAAFVQALHEFTPDVILAMHALPRFNAVESLRTAQHFNSKIPFIVMSATLDERIVDCLISGAADFVRKQQLVRLGPALSGAVGRRRAREEKTRADAAMREDDERFRLAAENFPGMVYLRRHDERYGMLYVNDAAETLTGYSKEAFLESTITLGGLCRPEQSAIRDAKIERAVAGGAPFHLVYRLRHSSGRWRWVEEHGVGVYRDGEPTYVEGFLRDITEQRRIRRRLRQQKDRAQTTLASIGEAVITADLSGRIQFMNPAAERLTGWRYADAGGRPLTDLVKPLGNAHSSAENPIVQCMREERIVGVADEAVVIKRNGYELAIMGSAGPIRDGTGKLTGTVVVFHDVTQPRAKAKQMAYDATHDALTGLINRHEFDRRLERAVTSARTDLANHTLCYLDLDQFKLVNDTDGHLAGDALLRQLGLALGVRMRMRDTLARLGGDEFGVLLEHCSPVQARRVAADLLRAVREFRFLWDGKAFSVHVSIGVAPILPTSESPTAVLRDADIACYSAKSRGGNCVHIFGASDLQVVGRLASRGRVASPIELGHNP